MTLPRFLADDLDAASGTASLSLEESHHLTHVLRLTIGDEVAVFDGRGLEYRARVERLGRDGARVRLIEPIAPAPETAVRLTLAQAVLKGDKMDEVIRDATMMGVGAIEPVVTERTMVRLKALADGRAVERWRRIAIASAKQCRRAVVPLVGPGIELSECVVRDAVELRMMLVEPAAARAGHPLSTLGADRPSSATLLVGPEGGWSVDEIDAAVSAGWIPITAGRRTFRAEAAAPIAMAVLQFLWGDL